ncbi:MAG: 3-deoxy-7-phosphoheptulonate synthase [bacterium]|nr:3-deoxy-7-phosphoheptulonate synthase [bacterium]
MNPRSRLANIPADRRRPRRAAGSAPSAGPTSRAGSDPSSIVGYASGLRAVPFVPGVDLAVPSTRVPRRVLREFHPCDTTVNVGPIKIGQGQLTLIAGPCAVENEEQLLPLAQRLAESGAHLLRGGAYKPRTSPYDFQGLGEPALRLLARAREQTGLPIVTEAVDEASLERVVEYADVVQIGARNMHNFALLKRAGRCGRPVFLKRGFSATLEDLLLAAEYVLDAGNPDVILCERGIRTFSDHSRFTLDLAILPRLAELSHLPVFVDPSHASGRASSVAPLALAAVAAGADGVMLEVHPEPERALSDGVQSLRPDQFPALAAELTDLACRVRRMREAVS